MDAKKQFNAMTTITVKNKTKPLKQIRNIMPLTLNAYKIYEDTELFK